MKTMWERISAVKDVYSDKFTQGLGILLVLFFLTFGVASLYMLLNSAA
jgi:hypothetical protein